MWTITLEYFSINLKLLLGQEPGVYTAEFDNPSSGWRAFFIRVRLAGPSDQPYEFTSEAHVIPDTYPFKRCIDENCKGLLV